MTQPARKATSEKEKGRVMWWGMVVQGGEGATPGEWARKDVAAELEPRRWQAKI